MERNGFTLVELLATIAILGLLIVIVATKGFGAFNKTKESINQLEEDNLLEAAKSFLVEIDNELCTNCPTRDQCIAACFVQVGDLESNNFFDDKGNNCNNDAMLELKIKIDSDGNTIGYSAKKVSNDIICSN